MSKFTYEERSTIKSIVAALTIKRIPDNEIIEEIHKVTNKTVTRKTVYNIRNKIKKESYDWYKTLREGEYEYIHEFKDRINEIIWLQRKHHEIIEKNVNLPQIQQASLVELHKLNVTLSNYFDVVPDIIGNSSLPTSSQNQSKTEPTSEKHETIIV
jgi:hypothetical protein